MKDKSETLTKLEAQKLMALQRGDTKTASLIQRIINTLTKKK
jgi:hypothetical protein